MSDLAAKIKQQIEFYFGDSNLPRDKFLLNIVSNDPNGYVPLETIMTFKRVQTLSSNSQDIIEAMKDSTIVEFNEDNTLIKRKVPLPGQTKEAMGRTVLVSTFPTTITLDDLLTFFKNYGNVNCVRMNRNSDREFKGSVFVEMSTKEECDNIINQEISFSGQILETKQYLEEYLGAKREAKKMEKKKKNFDDRDKYPKNCLVKITNIGEGVEREDIQSIFEEICQVKYIDFGRGKREAHLRFPNKDECKKCMEYTQPLIVKDQTLVLTLLAGDEESQYINKIRDDRKRKINKSKSFRRNKKSKSKEGDDVHENDNDEQVGDE